MDERHLAEVRRRCPQSAADRLTTLLGAAPQVLETWRPPRPLHCTLIANVLHFLSPSHVDHTLAHLHALSAPGAALFLCVDSPWTHAFRPFWPFYTLRKRMLQDAHPGFTRLWGPLRRTLLPERLSAILAYQPMEPWQVRCHLESAGWRVLCAESFAGDAAGNPEGVCLGNGAEMVGAHAVKEN